MTTVMMATAILLTAAMVASTVSTARMPRRK